MTEKDRCICVGCGKEIAKYKSPKICGTRAVEVRIGKVMESQVVDGNRRRGRPRLSEDEFKYESTWGLMHLDCFLLSIESTDLILPWLSN